MDTRRNGDRAVPLPGRRELAKDATLRLPRGRNGVVVRAEGGSLVVTQEGDPEDHVLGPGEEVHLPRGGLAVAWALSPVAVLVRDPVVAVERTPRREPARAGARR